MVNVEPIDLEALGVRLPHTRVGVVLAHPRINLANAEPFRWPDAERAQALSAIAETLRLARTNPHGEAKTHFTVFPEYAIPGTAGINAIEDAMNQAQWPSGTIVIGGTDGLSRDDYLALEARQHSHVAAINAGAQVPDARWLNCAIIWVKAGDGTLHRYLQPKISPARDENNTQYQLIHLGRSIFVFSGRYEENNGTFRFATLVCFDWISSVGGKKPWAWLLESLHQQALALGGQISLTWLFNIQHNPKPNHGTCLAEIPAFFDHTQLGSARRDHTSIFFVNSAGHTHPGVTKTHGHSGLVFYQNALFDTPPCNFTHNNGGQRFRQSNVIHPHIDVLFRENGACIHSFGLNNPAAMAAGPGNRQKALNNAFVFPIPPGAIQPRAPGDAVAGSTKWFNDTLDNLPRWSVDYAPQPLTTAIDGTRQTNETELRAKNAGEVRDLMGLAVAESKAQHADDWSEPELKSLDHIVRSLDVFRLGYPALSVAPNGVHAYMTIAGKEVDLIAVCGNTHEACLRHAAQAVPKPRRHTVIISRDRDNTGLQGHRTSYLTPKRTTLNTEFKYTDAATARIYVGFGEVLHAFINANSSADLEAALRGSLS